MHIDDLELTIRSHKRLTSHGIDTVEKLIQMDWRQLEAIDGLGDKSITEIVWSAIRILNGTMLKQLKDIDNRYPPEHVEQARRYREIVKIVQEK